MGKTKNAKNESDQEEEYLGISTKNIKELKNPTPTQEDIENQEYLGIATTNTIVI